MNEIEVPAEQMTPAYVALCEKLGFKVVESKPPKSERSAKKAALRGAVAVPPWAKDDVERYGEAKALAKAVREMQAKREIKALKSRKKIETTRDIKWMCETFFVDGMFDGTIYDTEEAARKRCVPSCTQIQVVKKGGQWVRA